MLYRATDVLASTTGDERATKGLVDATPLIASNSCATVVLAHLHAEPANRRWWKSPPAVASLGTTTARPGERFIPDDSPADLLALLDTLSLDVCFPDDLRREVAVLDHLERVIALNRERVAARQPHHALGA